MKIDQLTFTRFIAALFVFIFHYGRNTFFFSQSLEPIFLKGNISVSYFFVLSGFILYIVYGGKIKLFNSILPFYKARIARIFPAYLFALVLCLLFFVIFWGEKTSISEILLSVFLIQSWVPNYELVINYPGWSLSVEAFFYIVFPIIIILTSKISRKMVIIIFVSFFILSQIAHVLLFNSSLGKSIVLYNPLLHLSGFLMGVVFGIIYSDGTYLKYFRRNNLLLMTFILTLMFYFLIINPFTSVYYHNGMLSPLFGVFILCLALDNSFISKVLSIKPLVFLGEISFGIYIYQYPALYFSRLIQEFFHFRQNNDSLLIHLTCLIILSTVSYFTIEKPIRILITSKQQVNIKNLFSLKS